MSLFEELPIDFISQNESLKGTLSLPNTSQPAPVVLLLPGSGKTDRDDNTKQIAINLFPPIVKILSDLGFATIRYDKRGVGESEGKYFETGFDDLFEDAKSGLVFIKTRKEIDPSKVFVLGHSEGALIALRLAAGGYVAGAALLAGSAKTGEETIIWQSSQVAKSLQGFSAFVIKLFRIDVVKSVQKNLTAIKKTNKDSLLMQGRRVNAKWMREFLAYDPVMDLSKTKVPLLVITGSNDIQVDPEDVPRMAELALGDTETHVLDGLSHLFRKDPERSGLRSYKKQSKTPVDQSLMDTLMLWFEKQRS